MQRTLLFKEWLHGDLRSMRKTDSVSLGKVASDVFFSGDEHVVIGGAMLMLEDSEKNPPTISPRAP